MQWSFTHLRGYALRATDGEIGQVRDVFFEDTDWAVRYLVVDTHGWLTGRRVLIVPGVLGRPDPDARTFPVSLTRKQVEDSPDVDCDKPVSRQEEVALHGHYGWWPYWTDAASKAPPLWGTDPALESVLREAAAAGDPHLRSAERLTGYAARATDGDIGRVSDVLIDEDGWRIRWLVVDTGHWLPSKAVLLSTAAVEGFDFERRRVSLSVGKARVEEAPTYDPAVPVDRETERRLYEHYGQRPYW